jgi:hypothetical protein
MYDGTKLSLVAERLISGRALVASSWGQGMNNPHPKLGKYCAMTATGFGPEALEAQRVLCDALGVNGYSELWRWNDAPERTQQDVLDLYDRALANSL